MKFKHFFPIHVFKKVVRGRKVTAKGIARGYCYSTIWSFIRRCFK